MPKAYFNAGIDRGKQFIYLPGAAIDIIAGDVFVAGSTIGIAAECAGGSTVRATKLLSGITYPDRCALVIEHEDVTIAKAAAALFSIGDKVYWDVADQNVNTDESNPLIGVALQAGINDQTTLRIAFDGKMAAAAGDYFNICVSGAVTAGATDAVIAADLEQPFNFKIKRAYAALITAPTTGKTVAFEAKVAATADAALVSVADAAVAGEAEALDITVAPNTDLDILMTTTAGTATGNFTLVLVCQRVPVLA